MVKNLQNMFRRVFSLFFAAEVFFTRDQCVLKRLCVKPASTTFQGVKPKCLATRNYLTHSKKSHNNYFLLGGILTFLGLKKKDDEESELIMMIKQGVLYMKRGQYEDAETALNNALSLASQERNEDGIYYVLDTLANLFLDTGNWKKAEKMFVDVFKYLMKKGYDINDDKLVHISLKLAKIYEMSKDYLKAESGYQHCIKVLGDKVKTMGELVEKEIIKNTPTLKLWVTTLDSFARFLVNQSRAKEALGYFQQAFYFSVKVYGMEHENTALLLNDLGMTSNSLGDLDSAISYTEQAVNIGRKIAGMENLSIFYVNLGYLYLTKGWYKESRIVCEMGMTLAKKEENKDVAENAQECLKKIQEASQ